MLILITLVSKGVKLGFTVGGLNSFAQLNLLTNQSLFDFSIEEYTLVYNEDSRQNDITVRELQYETCTLESFDYPREILEAYNTEIFLCLIDEDYKIKGGLIARNSNYLNITVSRCKDKSYCLSDSQINDFINSNNLSLFAGLQSYYFDSDNYDDPLQSYFDNDLNWYISPGLQKTININFQHNKLTDISNSFSFGHEHEYEYYTANNIRDDYKIEDDTHQLINIIFRLDTEIIHQTRTTSTLSDVIAEIGGFSEIIKLMFYYSVSKFSMNLFMSYIFKQMFFKNAAIKYSANDSNRVHNISNNQNFLGRRTCFSQNDVSIDNIDTQQDFENIQSI